MSATEVAVALNCAATCTSTGRLVSKVDFKLALAVAETVTATAGFVHVALSDAELSQLALQSAAALQLGGVSATSQLGAVNCTSHDPAQVPVHDAVALAAAVHEP